MRGRLLFWRRSGYHFCDLVDCQNQGFLGRSIQNGEFRNILLPKRWMGAALSLKAQNRKSGVTHPKAPANRKKYCRLFFAGSIDLERVFLSPACWVINIVGDEFDPVLTYCS